MAESNSESNSPSEDSGSGELDGFTYTIRCSPEGPPGLPAPGAAGDSQAETEFSGVQIDWGPDDPTPRWRCLRTLDGSYRVISEEWFVWQDGQWQPFSSEDMKH